MKKKIKLIYVTLSFFCLLFVYVSNTANSAATSSGSGSNDNSKDEISLYKDAKRYILREKKLEKKNKNDKALKLYSKAYKRLLKAYKKDKKNPDILNYLGFALRKLGNLEEAEKYYLLGLNIESEHHGINEYLGELYITTNRMNLAKERLQVLKNCNCEEYDELKELIEKN